MVPPREGLKDSLFFVFFTIVLSNIFIVKHLYESTCVLYSGYCCPVSGHQRGRACQAFCVFNSNVHPVLLLRGFSSKDVFTIKLALARQIQLFFVQQAKDPI